MYTFSLKNCSKFQVFYKQSPSSYPDSQIIETSDHNSVDIPDSVKNKITAIIEWKEINKENLAQLFEQMKAEKILSNPELFRKVLLRMYMEKDGKMETTDINKRLDQLKDFTNIITDLSLQHAEAMHASKYEIAIKWIHASYENQITEIKKLTQYYLNAHRPMRF